MRLWVLPGLIAAAAGIVGCQASAAPVASGAPAATAPARAGASGHPDLDAFRSVREHEHVARPVRVRIPKIAVASGLETLHRAPDLSVEVPRDPASAGWYAGGPRPGQQGPAVILGHLDSSEGPAVFYRVPELRRGDRVLVDLADGETVNFVVSRVERYPKERFPTAAVYFPTLRSELRLVTCGGSIDPASGHYRDNVIAFATRTD